MRELIVAAGFGTGEPAEDILEWIAAAGFDGIFSVWKCPGCFAAQAARAKELGLGFDYAHAPYTGAAHMWETVPEAEAELQLMETFLEDCAGLDIAHIFLHTIIGMAKCSPCPLGAERFGRLFDRAEQLGQTIYLENTEGECYLEYLFNAFPDRKNVRFCIDTGHELCYNRGRNLIGKYAHRLGATHLNDNMGQTGSLPTWFDDSHLLPFDGIRDWKETAARLKKAGYAGPMIFELTKVNKPGRNTNDIYLPLSTREYIGLAYERACRFRQMTDN